MFSRSYILHGYCRITNLDDPVTLGFSFINVQTIYKFATKQSIEHFFFAFTHPIAGGGVLLHSFFPSFECNSWHSILTKATFRHT